MCGNIYLLCGETRPFFIIRYKNNFVIFALSPYNPS